MKLLALDLDGTLLRHDKTVDPRDVDAIRAVRAAGVRVTIVTGRLRTGSVYAARACEIEGMIGCVEGSHVVDVTGGTTHARHAIAAPQIDLMRRTFAENGLATFVFDHDSIHHDESGARFAPYVATWSPDMRLVEDHHAAWSTEPLAAVALGSAEAIARVSAILREHAAELFSVNYAVTHLPDARDVHAIFARTMGPSKGTALAELCALEGCTLADAVAVGDWVNDVPMFEVAGRSFAMGGAPPHVAAKATDRLVRLAGEGGGIAEAIDRAMRG